ncbi:long-chain-fatty-acid--CoA ligase [Streptomyces sp. bgisy034]|uniref:long-chain-fatty-acid--CoA ligase n=1 Tax=Streptomyces sp. bgisy034 TaxID=3413774 RepID=UPI003EC15468
MATATPHTAENVGCPEPGSDLHGILDFWNETAPGAEALAEGDRRSTWSGLADRVALLAAALAADGLRPGEHFATLNKNSSATIEATFAAARDGYAHVIVNWRLSPGEVEYVLADSQTRVLLVGAEFLPQVEEIRERLPHLRKIVVVGGDTDEYEKYLTSATPVPRGHRPEPDDCVLLLYTSGTTGFPKGAMLTHRGLGAHCVSAAAAFGFSHDSVNMVAMPLFHVGGISWALIGLWTSARTVLVRDVVPAAVLDRIRREGVTHAFFVPTVYEYFLATPELDQADLSSLQCLGYGGSPMPLPLMRRCLERFPTQDFYQVYGMTEASGVFSVLGPDAHRDPDRSHLLTSAGRPVAGVQVRVASPLTGEEVPAGRTGEFWIRSAQVMAGYWDKPEVTAESFSNGWFRTGDAGFMDDDGFLFIRDRVKDMIISGGENIYPVEVERVINQHPAVAEVCVIGVPDPTYVEAVKAVVTVTSGAAVDAAELIAFCRARLAAYKCPKTVEIVQELPRTATGKVLKRELRKAYSNHTDNS